jgi:hypothetical protein
MKKSLIQPYLRKNWKTTISGLISAIAAYWIIDHTLRDAPLTYKLAQWAITIGYYNRIGSQRCSSQGC